MVKILGTTAGCECTPTEVNSAATCEETEDKLGWSNSNVTEISTPNSEISYYTSSDAASESTPAPINGTSVLISCPIISLITEDT